MPNKQETRTINQQRKRASERETHTAGIGIEAGLRVRGVGDGLGRDDPRRPVADGDGGTARRRGDGGHDFVAGEVRAREGEASRSELGRAIRVAPRRRRRRRMRRKRNSESSNGSHGSHEISIKKIKLEKRKLQALSFGL